MSNQTEVKGCMVLTLFNETAFSPFIGWSRIIGLLKSRLRNESHGRGVEIKQP